MMLAMISVLTLLPKLILTFRPFDEEMQKAKMRYSKLKNLYLKLFWSHKRNCFAVKTLLDELSFSF